jgi:hypothetical protein
MAAATGQGIEFNQKRFNPVETARRSAAHPMSHLYKDASGWVFDLKIEKKSTRARVIIFEKSIRNNPAAGRGSTGKLAGKINVVNMGNLVLCDNIVH